MEQLIKPNDYALSMGLSKQDVYRYIKEGILVGKIISGVMYVVVDESELEDNEVDNSVNKDNDVLAAKDETIAMLKQNISDLKDANNEITTTLKSEIELLKEAFWEMKSIYTHQLEDLSKTDSNNDTIDVDVNLDKKQWIGLKKLFKKYQIVSEKKQEKVKKRVQKAYQNKDISVKLVNNRLKVNISMDIDKFIK